MTPPGSTSASYSLGLASFSALSTFTLSPHSLMFQPLISPLLGAITTVSAPASSSALRGSVNSACSNPSVARITIFLPFKFEAIESPPRLCFHYWDARAGEESFPHEERQFHPIDKRGEQRKIACWWTSEFITQIDVTNRRSFDSVWPKWPNFA